MKKIVICRWIPASWKSTWAKQEVLQSNAVRFNKDDIRKEEWLFPAWYFYSKENEEVVMEEERSRVENSMRLWKEYIIVDNTHLWNNNKHIAYYRSLSEYYWYEFIIKDFWCSREEAIKRDNEREPSERVGEEVINKMIKIQGNWGYPHNPTFKEEVWNMPDCVIVDIDWTLAFMDEKRSPYEFDKVKWDRCNEYLLKLIDRLPYSIFIVSWRSDSCRKETEEWLRTNWVEYSQLYMRKEWDNRCDTIIKSEIYEEHIKDKYNVFAVFDDRQKVCDMWRLKYHLPCYQVWYWNF